MTRNETLFSALRPIAKSTAKKFASRQPQLGEADIFAAADLALWEHILRHSDKPQDEIGRMAWQRVQGALLDYARLQDNLTIHQRRGLRDQASNAPMTEARRINAALVSRVESVPYSDDTDAGDELSPEDETIRKDELNQLHIAVSTLPRRTRTVLRGYYQRDKGLEELSEDVGISRGRYCQIQSTAVKTLRALMCTIAVIMVAAASTGCASSPCENPMETSGIVFCGLEDDSSLWQADRVVEILQEGIKQTAPGLDLAETFADNGLVVYATDKAIVTKCKRVEGSVGYLCDSLGGFFVANTWAIYINDKPCAAYSALAHELIHAALEGAGIEDDEHSRDDLFKTLVARSDKLLIMECKARKLEGNGKP